MGKLGSTGFSSLDYSNSEIFQPSLKSPLQTGLGHPPSYACFSRLMSILSICSIAFITLFTFSGSLSCNSLLRMVGTICQDTPNLSVNHAHRSFRPPADNFSHNSSTSSCVSQFTTNEMAGVNL